MGYHGAVGYHGYPRYTGDLDILIHRSPGNAARILSVLRKFGFGTPPISEADLLTEGNVVQLGFPPVRIDLITSLDGVDNAVVFANLIEGEFYGMRIPVISKPDLIRNKKATGRTRDLLDLENLE